MKRGLAFLVCLLPQFALVAGLAAREERALRTGVEVELEIGAVDPMSLFAGRYVSTPLRIATLDPAATRIPQLPAERREVWVRLGRQAAGWTATEVCLEPPSEEGALFLAGTWMGANRVDYGLDRFYIPEDGEDPSRLARRGDESARLQLRLRVTAGGHGVITDLLIDGVSYREWNAAEQAQRR